VALIIMGRGKFVEPGNQYEWVQNSVLCEAVASQTVVSQEVTRAGTLQSLNQLVIEDSARQC
jgi:hypothetical protein